MLCMASGSLAAGERILLLTVTSVRRVAAPRGCADAIVVAESHGSPKTAAEQGREGKAQRMHACCAGNGRCNDCETGYELGDDQSVRSPALQLSVCLVQTCKPPKTPANFCHGAGQYQRRHHGYGNAHLIQPHADEDERRTYMHRCNGGCARANSHRSSLKSQLSQRRMLIRPPAERPVTATL